LRILFHFFSYPVPQLDFIFQVGLSPDLGSPSNQLTFDLAKILLRSLLITLLPTFFGVILRCVAFDQQSIFVHQLVSAIIFCALILKPSPSNCSTLRTFSKLTPDGTLDKHKRDSMALLERL
jgi:hypothetical protein